jgi:hypothetical protein
LALALALCVLAAAGVASAAAVAPGPSAQADTTPKRTLSAFRSDKQLRRFLKRVRRAPPRVLAVPSPAPAPPPMAAAAPADGAAPAEAVSALGRDGDSITNTQEAGVDEGGIVKVRGDTLVILRRGRLFTVSTKRGDLRPIDSINAYPPGVDARGDWYDEMLVAGNRVIVIGYSYSRGGTEINRFHIDRDGYLAFEDAYHLRSNDYYSSRNFASRLIGNRLIVYSPLYVPYRGADALLWLPAVRRWSGDPNAPFRRVVSAREIYLPPDWRDDPDESDISALHTVTDCDLTAPVLRCRARSVFGPAGRTFYVSANAVYVWMTRWGRRRGDREGEGASLLYRLPLGWGAPSAVGVHGSPVDQFSFREDWADGKLNVLVRSEGGGDAMWEPEFSSGAVALLQLPLNWFNDGREEASRRHYRKLPRPGGDDYGAFQNRFVGDYLLYGTGTSWGRPQGKGSVLVAASVREDDEFEIPLEHGVDRIEAMGRDAVVVGGDSNDLHFRAVELTAGPEPRLGDRYTLEGASQGETRSHAFFFKPEPRADGDGAAGVLALPVARAGRPGHRQLVEGSASIIFIRRASRAFAPLGELWADEEGVVSDDGCQASCVDWYGNARPIFLRDRTFALMGYELVEGEVGARAIREVRRINFAPRRRER